MSICLDYGETSYRLDQILLFADIVMSFWMLWSVISVEQQIFMWYKVHCALEFHEWFIGRYSYIIGFLDDVQMQLEDISWCPLSYVDLSMFQTKRSIKMNISPRIFCVKFLDCENGINWIIILYFTWLSLKSLGKNILFSKAAFANLKESRNTSFRNVKNIPFSKAVFANLKESRNTHRGWISMDVNYVKPET